MRKARSRTREPRTRVAAEDVLSGLEHAVLAVDRRGRIAYANRAAGVLIGQVPQSLNGRTLASFVTIDRRPHVHRALRRAQAGYPVRGLECSVDTSRGESVWIEVDLTPSRTGCLVLARDVRERRVLRTEVTRQHNELEETLASLLDTIPVGIVIADGRGQPRLVNRAARDLLGIHALAPLERWCDTGILRRPDGSPATPEDVPAARTLSDGVPRRDIEIHVVRPWGEAVPVLLNTDAVHDATGDVIEVCCTFTNIRERRHIERQLQQSQKMEAIGTLAGGIAHDFNNILCAITGYSELALKQVHLDERSAQLVEEIRKASARASTLTRQLLSFSRMDALAPQVLDLDGTVEDMLAMLKRLIGEDIELDLELAGDIGPIKADPGHIEQVVLNLVINAGDAIERGGRVRLSTESVTLPSSGLEHRVSLAPGPYAVLTVSDDGAGMDEETMARIFEPFFTTKERGKGTGLGLSTVYGIVKQMRGTIHVESRPKEGAAFRVYLPCAEAAPEPPSGPKALPEAVHRGGETLLLVEDESLVRALIREVLEDSGYRVLEASNGQEALELATATPETIQLLVTDVVMPVVGGRELARRLQRLKPELRVLFVSGYTNDALAGSGVLEGATAFLPKPFDAQTLTSKVRELLDHVVS